MKDDTPELLHSAALRLLRFARIADKDLDLDGPRASALSVLVFGGPLTLGQLADQEQVTPPAITKTIGLLEANGLVERQRSATDRRVWFVRATTTGRALLLRGRDARVRRIDALMTDLPDADRATLHRAAKILHHLLPPPPGVDLPTSQLG